MNNIEVFRQTFKQVTQLYACELAYLESLYDSTVEKLFYEILPKLRVHVPLTDEVYTGTYRKVIRDGYIPEFFITGELTEEVFVNEVSRVIRNRAYISNWSYSTLACKNAQQFTVNSLAMAEALMASTSFDKLGMERPEIGPFELNDCFCQEIQSPRDIVIRLTFMFYIIVLGYPFQIYTPHKTIPLVTLQDEELAKKITGVIKKKYDADPSFLFTKKFDRLFAPELMLTRFVKKPGSLLFGAPSVEAALKQRVKDNPNDEEAKDVLAAYQLYDQAMAAAVQFFKINMIAFFVDISDGKPPKDALEKLMVMMACLGSMNILKLSV